MALMLIGAMVADHLHEFHSKSGWRVIGAAVLLRQAVSCFPARVLRLRSN
jgi:hypothetical protein